jgi:sodium/potassium-transporting ATPase subunit alpha
VSVKASIVEYDGAVPEPFIVLLLADDIPPVNLHRFIPRLFMDTHSSDLEKSPNLNKDIEAVPIRSVAFPEDERHPRDEKQRPVGVEMRREMTEEDARLAAAGYEHLTKEKSGPETVKFGDVDITEHQLPIHEIEALLQISFNWTDPAQSPGLTDAEAEARLTRDGPNALTPPKKKSALQKVCICARF